MRSLTEDYMTSAEVAKALGIRQDTVARLAREGTIRAEKVAKTWLIPRSYVQDMAKGDEGKRGRPRTKRKYTRRAQR